MISIQKLFGKDDAIMNLLEASATEVNASARQLARVLSEKKSLPDLAQFAEFRRREKAIHSEIGEKVAKTFVTMLEREDIEALQEVLYKIPKTVEKFIERLIIFKPVEPYNDFKEFPRMIEQATEHVLSMVKALKHGAHIEDIQEINGRLQQVEGDADKLILVVLKDLYSGKHEAQKVMVMKDLFELLEKIVDRCRDAGNLMTHIILKNS